MKKLFFLIILLFPLCIYASSGVEIDRIELVEKSDNTVILDPAKSNGLQVSFNFKFVEVNDYARYKIYIKNNSNYDYKIDNNSIGSPEDSYISYVYEGNNDLIINAGESEIIIVKVIYQKQIEDKDFVDNSYMNESHIELSLVKENVIENPNTNSDKIGFCYFLIILLIILCFYGRKHKKELLIIVICIVGIPLLVRAVELLNIDIHIKVEIEKPVKKGTFSLCSIDSVYEFEEGMSFGEWLDSDYNINSFDPAGGYVCVNGYVGYKCSDENIGRDHILEDGAFYECHPFAECVAPDSKILIDNNLTKLAKDIKENDRIMYYDFYDNIMKQGYVEKVYIHRAATDFIRYTLEDGSYLESTDYHLIYTKDGWKSYTNKYGYTKPIVGDIVKTNDAWKKIIKIELYKGREDFYDFSVVDENGNLIDNYYASGMLVHSAYEKSR